MKKRLMQILSEMKWKGKNIRRKLMRILMSITSTYFKIQKKIEEVEKEYGGGGTKVGEIEVGVKETEGESGRRRRWWRGQG